MQKRIMILGGNAHQALATKTARSLGLYAISADIHPGCPGHKEADESCLIDIADKEAVLREARRLRIDGIISYTSDQLASVAAYVAEAMSLPGNPYRVVETMNHKHLFRDFMRRHGFLTPKGGSCTTAEEAVALFHSLHTVCMMKPCDASASRGVFRIETEEALRQHWQESLAHSASGTVIIEEYIELTGIQQDGDIFVENGEITFWELADQLKDTELSPYMPAILRLPTSMPRAIEEHARSEVQRLLTALGFRMGPCNVEYNVDADGRVYILEIGPRNGGNMIPQATEAATGFAITAATILQAVGEDIDVCKENIGCQPCPYALSYIIHTDRAGRFRSLETAEWVRPYVREIFLQVKEGDTVRPYLNGRDAVGMAMLSFPTREEMDRAVDEGIFTVHFQD